MYRWFGTRGALLALSWGLVSSAMVSIIALLIGGQAWALAAGCWVIGVAAGYAVGRLHADELISRAF